MGIDDDLKVAREQERKEALEALYRVREVLPKRANRLIRVIDEALLTRSDDVLGQAEVRDHMKHEYEVVRQLTDELGDLIERSQQFWET